MKNLLALLPLLLVACSEPESEPIAMVGETEITEETFRYWWEREMPLDDSEKSRSAVLDQIVRRAALVQVAREAGLDQDPEVAAAIDSILIAKLQERELQPDLAEIKISDADAQAIYDRDGATHFTTPEQHHISLLWFDTRGQAPLEARYSARLEKVREIILADSAAAPNGFGRIAVANSEHTASRHRNGDLGWLKKGQQDPVLNIAQELASHLSPGELSSVVSRPEGTFLVRLMGHRPAGTEAFAKVKGQIIADLKRARRVSIQSEFDESTWQKIPVTRSPGALAKITDLRSNAVSSK